MPPPEITRKIAKGMKNIYRGYVPPDLPQNRPRNRTKPWWRVLGKPVVTMYPQPEVEEWSAEPEYPPINDASEAGLKRQVRLDWYETIKTKPTAEEKLYEISHHARHHVANINNWLPTCQSLPFIKYITQTHVIDSLPVGYDVRPSTASQTSEQATRVEAQTTSIQDLSKSDLTNRIRQLVLDHIRSTKYESQTKKGNIFVSRPVRDRNTRPFESARFIENLVTQMRKVMVYETNPQLLDYQLDLSPSIRSWWYHSGMPAPNNKIYYNGRKDENGSINQIFQLTGASALNMRSDSMIEPILDMDDPLVTDTSLVEKCNYYPRYYGATYKFKWPSALAGFWFEEIPQYDCPHTSFLSTDCLKLRHKIPMHLTETTGDVEDCLNGQAILTAFGWLNSLAMYHGFTPFHQIDYPLTCQVVTTDGQNWLFNVYQFNSSTFHRDLGGPQKNNVCWSSGVMQLYSHYENGQFTNVNDNVIDLLVKCFSMQVSQEYTNQLNLRPYLSEDMRSEEEKDEARRKLRDLFEQRYNRWQAMDWQVPEFEHIWFRARVTRNKLKGVKPKWHTPKPKMPKIFE